MYLHYQEVSNISKGGTKDTVEHVLLVKKGHSSKALNNFSTCSNKKPLLKVRAGLMKAAQHLGL